MSPWFRYQKKCKNVFYVMLYNGRFKTRFKPIVHCHSENRSVNTKVKFTNRVIVKINNRNYFYDVSLIGYDYLLINFNRNKGGYKILDPFIPISRFTAQCNSRFQHWSNSKVSNMAYASNFKGIKFSHIYNMKLLDLFIWFLFITNVCKLINHKWKIPFA